MNKQIQVGDRVLVQNSGYNSIAKFYVVETNKQDFVCKMEYGLITATINVDESQIFKHPIQILSFLFQVTFEGNRMPETNDFDTYFKNFKTQEQLLKFASKSVIEIILDARHREYDFSRAIQILLDSLHENNPISELNDWISGTIERVPENFNCVYELEYSISEETVYFNSSFFNLAGASMFLYFFTAIILELKILSAKDLIFIINKLGY